MGGWATWGVVLLAGGVLGTVFGVVISPWVRRGLGHPESPERSLTDAPQPSERPAADTPREAIDRELERSRRHARPFVVVRLPGQAPHPPGEGGARAHWSALRPQVRKPLTLLLRSIDRYSFDRRDLFLILPETGRDGALRMVSRIAAEVPGLSDPDAVRMVVFPEDGVTGASLLHKLYRDVPRRAAADGTQIDSLPVLPVVDLRTRHAPATVANGSQSLDAEAG